MSEEKGHNEFGMEWKYNARQANRNEVSERVKELCERYGKVYSNPHLWSYLMKDLKPGEKVRISVNVTVVGDDKKRGIDVDQLEILIKENK